MSIALWITGTLALCFSGLGFYFFKTAQGEGDGGFGDALAMYACLILGFATLVTWIILIILKRRVI